MKERFKDSFTEEQPEIGSLSFMHNKNGEVFETATSIIEASPYLLDDNDISKQFTEVLTKTGFKHNYAIFLKHAKPCFSVSKYTVYAISTPVNVQFVIFDNNDKEKSTRYIYYMVIAYNWSRNKLFKTSTSKGIYVSRVWKSLDSDIPKGFTVNFLNTAYPYIRHDYFVNDPGQTLAFSKTFTRFAKQFVNHKRVYGYFSFNRTLRFVVPLRTETQLLEFSKATTKSTIASAYKGFFILSNPANLKKSIYEDVPTISYDDLIKNDLFSYENYDQYTRDELIEHGYIEK